MKRLVILLMLIASCLFGSESSSSYITYDEFLKIKSYFREDGCSGIEIFLQSSKDLNVSNELNGDPIENLHYEILCLLTGSTDFTVYGEKDSLGNYKKSWTNKFPKNAKITEIGFYTPSKILNKCKNKNELYSIYYTKYYSQFKRQIYDRSVDFLDDTKPNELCITSQLSIFKSKPRFGTISNSKDDKKPYIVVYWNIYDTNKEKYRVPVNQKVRILGSINNYSYVYYNKKTKGVCDPLKFVDGCNSGWVDTNLIAEDK